MPDTNRTPTVSLLAGAVALAGVVAFAVALPEGSGADAEPASAPATGEVSLPDEITGGLVAVDLGTAPAELAQQLGPADGIAEQEASITAGLEDLYDAPSAMRLYYSAEPTALVQVLTVGQAPGPFVEALPIDPAVADLARPPQELVRSGDAVCSVNWGQPVPAGQPVDPTQLPQSVRCQLGDGDRTYDVTAQGLGVDATVGVAEALVGGGSEDQDQ